MRAGEETVGVDCLMQFILRLAEGGILIIALEKSRYPFFSAITCLIVFSVIRRPNENKYTIFY